jgi:hypothetical protein
MPTTGQRTQRKDMERHKRETLNAAVGAQVMHTLGEPVNLHTVQVRWLWEHRYRVNVFVGKDAGSVRIANSYFVRADQDGNILATSPKLAKRY